MRLKAKAIDWADPGRGRKQTVLPGCYHLILFQGPSGQQEGLREGNDSKYGDQKEHFTKTSAIP